VFPAGDKGGAVSTTTQWSANTTWSPLSCICWGVLGGGRGGGQRGGASFGKRHIRLYVSSHHSENEGSGIDRFEIPSGHLKD